MTDHNSTGIWDAVAFYIVLVIAIALVGFGMLHRHEHTRAPADGATARPAHRAP